ncbi:AI-2E family transporter [Candidatus Dojkabacteria bacterium]|nr:AI-2E family transporter [Candidatus Dojkabacteria bacterium]
MNKVYKVEITPKTIISVFVLIGFVWLIAKLYSVIFLIFIAFAVSAMLSPIIEFLNTKKIPRSVSITLIYLLFFGFLLFLVLVSYKPIVTQLEAFTKALPDIFVNVVNTIVERVPFIRDRFNWDSILDNLKGSFWQNIEISNVSSYLFSGLGKALGLVGSFFSILINFLTVIVLSVYFIQFKEGSKQKVSKLLPEKYRGQIIKFIDKIENQLGAWLRAQLLLMLIVGVLAWIGLEIIGMEFSIPLGIIAALLEIIPNIGPMITWLLAITVATGSDLPAWQTIFIAIWFILIQQIENYLVVPKLMQKFVGLNPAITIIAVLGASKIFNIWGALLAVPTVAIIQITIRYYLQFRREQNKNS